MRRRLISYLDALFVGMLLGLIFVSVMHAEPLHRRGEVQPSSVGVPPSVQKTIADASQRMRREPMNAKLIEH